MKEFKNARKNVGACSARPHIEKNAKGITLIALIITIVVMLILVVVSIRIALETGLFESAGKATKNWEEAQDKEAELGSGKVTIGGVTYNSIGEYTSSISGEVDFEKLFATAEKHPDQSAENNDIGIAEDGSIVNLDLWYYEIVLKGSYPEGYSLGIGWIGSMPPQIGYIGDIIDGKIQGKVPMYIKEEYGGFFPVLLMEYTFEDYKSLTKAPEIPSSVTNMDSTFYGCTSLTEAPKIPSSVTNMWNTFSWCSSLTKAPAIPSSVTSLYYTFQGCESLTEAPEIPSSVTDMWCTFYNCTSLTEAPEIPSSVTDMYNTFYGCTSLTKAPVIPSSVTSMHATFSGCTSLTEAPKIPSSVTDMRCTFSGCAALNGTIVINASNINRIGDGSTSYPYIFNEITNNLTVKVPANSTTYEKLNSVYGTSSNITIETF